MLNKQVGYRPGMAHIAGCLLIHSPAEDSFWMLASIIDRVRGYYSSGNDLAVDSLVLTYLLEAVDKPLAKRVIVSRLAQKLVVVHMRD